MNVKNFARNAMPYSCKHLHPAKITRGLTSFHRQQENCGHPQNRVNNRQYRYSSQSPQCTQLIPLSLEKNSKNLLVIPGPPRSYAGLEGIARVFFYAQYIAQTTLQKIVSQRNSRIYFTDPHSRTAFTQKTLSNQCPDMVAFP